MFMYQKFVTFNEFKFVHPGAEEGELFSYSSELDKIGIENDISIPNGIYVGIISSPTIINVAKYGGKVTVIKVQADVATDYHTIIKEFWVPTQYIVKV